MLKEQTLFGLEDKVQKSIDRLQAFCPPEGYILAFSGGKDSQCIYHLAKMAGVKFEAVYNVTSVDPPELVRFIKSQYPNVRFQIPRYSDGTPITMWNLIVKKGILPMVQTRFCCEKLKESTHKGRLVVTGVRWAESIRRKNLHGIVSTRETEAPEGVEYKLNDRGSVVLNNDNDESRRMVEHCYRTSKVIINPIVDWTEEDVWEFLNDVAKVPHCQLYDEGFPRIGCIGCPMGSPEQRQMEFARWHKYKRPYINAIKKMIAKKGDWGKSNGERTSDPEEIFNDWINNGGRVV